MPKHDAYGNWPSSGEIDIVESRGNAPGHPQGGWDTSSSALHWGPNWQTNRYDLTRSGAKSISPDLADANGFHNFSMVCFILLTFKEWTPEAMRTFIDGKEILNVPLTNFNAFQRGGFQTSNANPWKDACPQAPFDQEFVLMFNVAIGGTNGNPTF